MLTPWQARLMACALMLLAMRRGWQGWKIVRYHRNLLRPLPPVGGNPWLHGVELKEYDVTLPLSERPGHTLVLGPTRVGKTRLAELLATQDIRRGEVVIVFDPKGDADLLKRLWTETQHAGRGDRFILFHLAYPEISARYNAIGRFGRISEVASRLTGQLSGEGNSAAFREFAWRFVNIIARALVAPGLPADFPPCRQYRRPVYRLCPHRAAAAQRAGVGSGGATGGAR